MSRYFWEAGIVFFQGDNDAVPAPTVDPPMPEAQPPMVCAMPLVWSCAVLKMFSGAREVDVTSRFTSLPHRF